MSKKVCAKYIFYFLKANENYVKSFASGTSTKTITKQEVRDLSIVLPPLKEQLIISRIISSFENQIDYLQSKLVLFKSLKKSLSSDLLTGRKRVEV